MKSLYSAVLLSKGSMWEPGPDDAPYLLADYDQPWPAGATASIKFYDTSGGSIAEIPAVSVTPEFITFSATPSEVDVVPAGANFEIFLTTADTKTYQIRYGKVLRREAEFFDQPQVPGVYQQLLFTDTFPTQGLKSSWEVISGHPQIYNNSASSLPFGVSGQNGLTGGDCAMRWFEELNGNGVEVSVNLLNQNSGKARAIILGDQRLTTYLAVEWENTGDTIHFALGTDPTTVTYQGTAINMAVVDGDNYKVRYDPATDTVSVRKAADNTPLGSLPDVSTLLPMGPGYRHAGLAFHNGPLSSGLQVSYWSAQDVA